MRLGDALRIEELIGEGGMGSVFRAVDERLDRSVAVKFLHPGEAGLLERAEREAKALARLSHPAVVQVHDVGEHEGQPYLVMEFVDGQPLSDRIPLSVPEALRVVRAVADALGHAHSRGVVHRDIKPENVLVTADGEVKVTDFGIARSPADPEWNLTAQDRIAGTPHFLPPEALSGARPRPNWDVYGLGVLLRFCITGNPSGELSDAPPALRALVHATTHADPAERPQDGSAVRDRIDRLVSRGEAEELPSEYPSLAAGASLAGTIASACVLWVLYESFSPERIPLEQVRPLVMLTYGPPVDERALVLAQFRIGPTLLAAFAVALMLMGYAAVRRYWRVHGLERPNPERPVARAKTVLALGIFQCAAYLGRVVLLGDSPFAAIVPVLGGLVELVTLWFFWSTLLEMQRIHRPWAREGWLWVGISFALVPPVSDMARHFLSWLP